MCCTPEALPPCPSCCPSCFLRREAVVPVSRMARAVGQRGLRMSFQGAWSAAGNLRMFWPVWNLPASHVTTDDDPYLPAWRCGGRRALLSLHVHTWVATTGRQQYLCHHYIVLRGVHITYAPT